MKASVRGWAGRPAQDRTCLSGAVAVGGVGVLAVVEAHDALFVEERSAPVAFPELLPH